MHPGVSESSSSDRDCAGGGWRRGAAHGAAPHPCHHTCRTPHSTALECEAAGRPLRCSSAVPWPANLQQLGAGGGE
eukprot:387211-Rhodomonas_salina.1